jgi:hypothetical protein
MGSKCPHTPLTQTSIYSVQFDTDIQCKLPQLTVSLFRNTKIYIASASSSNSYTSKHFSLTNKLLPNRTLPNKQLATIDLWPLTWTRHKMINYNNTCRLNTLNGINIWTQLIMRMSVNSFSKCFSNLIMWSSVTKSPSSSLLTFDSSLTHNHETEFDGTLGNYDKLPHTQAWDGVPTYAVWLKQHPNTNCDDLWPQSPSFIPGNEWDNP